MRRQRLSNTKMEKKKNFSKKVNSMEQAGINITKKK